jgi:peptide/nickel transport system substrate-binding protein
MVTRRTAIGIIAGTALAPLDLARASTKEPPIFEAEVDSGALPPFAERLPQVPRVVNFAAMGRKLGRYGGSVRMLIGGQRDIRLMTIYGYARLVGYDESLTLQPDILESFEVVEGRIFTFRIRPGHKWSDGTPLTPEDFRYCWEDVQNNEDLSPGGLATYLKVEGKPPHFEIIDSLTVRYSWDLPNPDFLQQIAAPQPLSMVMPSAYLKQFHKKYQDAAKLDELVKKHKVKKWTSLHIRMARQYRPENPELPTLDPWRNRTEPPAEQFIFERNPYFHRVDETGRQLPYIDRFILSVSSSAIIPAKAGAGEVDLQANGVDFNDYTFLKEAEKRYPLKVLLWKRTQGSRLALLPNLNYGDEGWRNVLRDVRFRRALSVAIDRHEINMAAFFGLGRESADTVLPESPLYQETFAKAWAQHDPDLANALLDEAGLVNRDREGIRLLPDGRRVQIALESAGESSLETDVLELVADHWRKVGIDLFVRVSQRDVFRSRAVAGTIMMAIWGGIDNGIPRPDMNPSELAPTVEDQLQWPVWGLHYQSHGEHGSPPDLKEAIELVDLLKQWRRSTSVAQWTEIWTKMLSIYTDNVFSIGLVNGTLLPIVVSSKLRNIPKEGLFSFNPTCYFGVYMPDTFWWET